MANDNCHLFIYIPDIIIHNAFYRIAQAFKHSWQTLSLALFHSHEIADASNNWNILSN